MPPPLASVLPVNKENDAGEGEEEEVVVLDEVRRNKGPMIKEEPSDGGGDGRKGQQLVELEDLEDDERGNGKVGIFFENLRVIRPPNFFTPLYWRIIEDNYIVIMDCPFFN